MSAIKQRGWHMETKNARIELKQARARTLENTTIKIHAHINEHSSVTGHWIKRLGYRLHALSLVSMALDTTIMKQRRVGEVQ